MCRKVALFKRRNGKSTYSCGGVLISANHVVTGESMRNFVRSKINQNFHMNTILQLLIVYKIKMKIRLHLYEIYE